MRRDEAEREGKKNCEKAWHSFIEKMRDDGGGRGAEFNKNEDSIFQNCTHSRASWQVKGAKSI